MSDPAISAAKAGRVPLSLRAGTLACLVLLLFAFASIIWTPYAADAADAGAALQAPGSAHWLGTDADGRDVLSLLMRGMLTGIMVSGVGVAAGGVVGVAAGLLLRPRESRVGVDFPQALIVPALLVSIVSATLFGPSAIGVMVAIAVATVVPLVRIIRELKASVSRRDDLAAARLAGLTGWEAIRRHAFGPLADSFLSQLLTLLAAGIAMEATLSFAGLGTQAPATSLGLMLRDALGSMQARSLLAVAPGTAVVAMVLSLTVTARGLTRRSREDRHGNP